MADVLDVLNPTYAESAKRSILYGKATTFYGKPESASEGHIQKYYSNCLAYNHSKDITAKSVERATTLSYIRTTDILFQHIPEPTILGITATGVLARG